MSITCTWWSETGLWRHSLWVLGAGHSARRVTVDETTVTIVAAPTDDDQMWPTACDGCGEPILAPARHTHLDPLYQDGDGQRLPLTELPAGSLYLRAGALEISLPDGVRWRLPEWWPRAGDPARPETFSVADRTGGAEASAYIHNGVLTP